MTVLVAEDHEINMKIISFMLEKLGCTVIKAANGIEAADLFRENRPDMVIMDLQMPEMDGFDATREIRSHERAMGWTAVPVSALSANSSEKDRTEAKNAGMNHFLTKPVKIEDVSELLGIIQKERMNPTADYSDPVFDYDSLMEMFQGNGEILRLLLTEFLEGVPANQERIRKFIESEDYQSLNRTSHTVKGELLNIRAAEASEAFARLEHESLSGNKKAIEQARESCESSMAVLVERIKGYLTT